LDQDENNIYKYKSDIISFGYKKILICKINDPSIYAMVVCVQLNKELIRSQRFTSIENQDLLSKFMNKSMSMRIPDLRMLILDNYH
jgi:hypothetical protein